MTVSSEVSFVSHNGDGVTTTFPVPFYFIEASDLVVNVVNADGTTQLLALDTDYTVTGAGVPAGGSITKLGTTVPTGKSVQIERDPPVTQETDYQSNDPFPAEEHEKALDKGIMIAQRHARIFSNSLHFPTTETTDGTLPQKSVRALNLIGFDELGLPTMVPIPASVGAGDMKVDVFVKDSDFTPDVTTQLILSRPPGNPDNLLVFFDGVQQGPDQWGVSGSTLTFLSPIPAGVERVYARTGTTLSLYVPPDNSVGDSQISWAGILNRVVASIAQLKALDTTKYTRAFATGFYGSGDGGGGDYWFDSASVEAEVPGIIVAPNAGAGRWKLITWFAVSLKQAGAKIDGATNDSAAVQAAVNWVFTTAKGAELYHPGGTCVLNTKITAPKDTSRSFKIFGIGAGSVFKGGALFAGNLFEIGSAVAAGGVEYELRDFMIGAPVSGTCTGIKLSNCNTMRLHGIKMQLVTLGLQLDSCFAIRMTECLFDTITQNAIYSATACHNLVIDGCRFYSVGGTTFQTLQIDTDTDNIVINGCDFEQCFGVYGLTNPTAVRLTGNYIEYCVGAEFNHTGAVEGWVCHNNWIALNTQPTTTWSNINGGSFEGNTLFGQTSPENRPMNVAWGSNVKDVDVGTNTIRGTATLAPSPMTTVSSFLNSYTQGARTVSYSRSFDGRLTMRGVLNAGTLGSPAFLLPVGYRPIQQEWFCTVGGGNALAVVLVDTNGNVVPQTAPGSSVALDGISFIAKTTV